MKHTILLAAIASIVLAACEKDLPVYDLQSDAINFDVTLDDETGLPVDKYYSFVYAGSDVVDDTIWIDVTTQGFITDHDRPFTLTQVNVEGESNAIPGVHYTAFDAPDMTSRYVIPAGANEARIPIAVHRDATLEQGDVRLNVEVKPNAHFTQGIPSLRLYPIVISNLLTKPANWETYYFNAYGPVKHRFMIEQTGLRWDEEFIKDLLAGDYGYIKYITMLLYQRLQTVNAERQAAGLDILREADGKPVAFDYGGSF